MKKKSIWIINETIGSKHHGMVFRPFFMAREFVKNGNDVTIFSGSYSHVYSKRPDVQGSNKIEIIDDVKYCWLKTPKYSKSQSLGRIINAFVFVFKLFLVKKDNFTKPDVVIVTSPTPFSIINGYFFKKRYKAKLIFEVRDIWPLTLIEIGQISKYHPFVLFMQCFENFSYRVSDKVVSVLPYAYMHMEKHGLKEDKFEYIPNGISLDKADEIAEKIDNSVLSKIPEKKFIVMYTGKFGISNALEELLAAAQNIKEDESVVFVLVGNGPEKSNLIRIAKEKDLNNIVFLDPVPKSYIPELLKRADVCYIGLHKKPIFEFGVSANKLFDYMYAGKPVIYAIEDKNSIVEKSDCGISIASQDPDEIVKTIKHLKNIEQKDRAEMGERGRQFVITKHTYQKLAEKYEKLF